MLIMPNRQHLLGHLSVSMLGVQLILDFLLEILIIHSSPYWISTQGISIRMPHSWSMNYFEVVVLQ
jgi:hypothetical protein